MRLHNISLFSVFLFTDANSSVDDKSITAQRKTSAENGEILMSNHLKITLVSAALAVFGLPVVAQSTSTTAQSSTAALTPVTGESIQDRKENQQDRIAQGIRSGQLTAGEAAHLEHNQAKINQEVRADRQANGGKLTAQEKAQVNRQQNRQSRQIYRDKHNNRHQ
jgi:ketol-acid reductoisomerase